MNMHVAETIIKQLGGKGKLCAMVNARNFVGDDTSVAFRFSGNRSINMVKITLNGKDLYDVVFFRVRKFEAKPVKSFDDLYADSLKPVFETETGLYLSF